jgi:hypothetical protein
MAIEDSRNYLYFVFLLSLRRDDRLPRLPQVKETLNIIFTERHSCRATIYNCPNTSSVTLTKAQSHKPLTKDTAA